jgi:hypothetical protein
MMKLWPVTALGGVSLCVLVWVAGACAQSVAPTPTDPSAESAPSPEESPAPEKSSAPEAEAAAAVDEKNAEAVLAQFEAAGKDLKTIRCAVEFTTDDRLNLSETTKFGTVLVKRAEPHPMFLITIDKSESDGIVFRDKEWWLFKGRWLWEAKAKSSTIIKRELLAPGEQRDLFSLEDSPVPMPFGQSKDEVLKNFNVRLMPTQVGDPPDTDHLYCVPRDGRMAKDYSRLEYYVSTTTHLPVRIVAENASGTKVSIAEFRDVPTDANKPAREPLSARSINVEIPDTAFALPNETGKFHVSLEPLEDESASGK